MIVLRWILGLALAFFCVGFAVLLIFLSGFRKSFGASAMGPLVAFLPLAGAALLLAAIVFPTNRILLHAAAVAAAGMVGVCVWQIVAEQAGVLWFALVLIGAWFCFYWRAAFVTN